MHTSPPARAPPHTARVRLPAGAQTTCALALQSPRRISNLHRFHVYSNLKLCIILCFSRPSGKEQRCHIHPSAPHCIAKNEDVLSFALPLLSRDTSRQRHNAIVTPRGTAVQRAEEKSRRARSQGRCAVPAGVGGVAQVVQSNAAPSNVLRRDRGASHTVCRRTLHR